MKKTFVMRGQTASGETEVLNFSGFKPGYAYKLLEFQIYPSTDIGGTTSVELTGSITAAKAKEDPSNPNFENEGLIGTAYLGIEAAARGINLVTIVNDTFLITQDLILAVEDNISGSSQAVNWQCKFMPVKISGSEEAVANYKQFLISDG